MRRARRRADRGSAPREARGERQRLRSPEGRLDREAHAFKRAAPRLVQADGESTRRHGRNVRSNRPQTRAPALLNLSERKSTQSPGRKAQGGQNPLATALETQARTLFGGGEQTGDCSFVAAGGILTTRRTHRQSPLARTLRFELLGERALDATDGRVKRNAVTLDPRVPLRVGAQSGSSRDDASPTLVQPAAARYGWEALRAQ